MPYPNNQATAADKRTHVCQNCFCYTDPAKEKCGSCQKIWYIKVEEKDRKPIQLRLPLVTQLLQ